jgi:CheY-like chemotaxis protein
MRVLIVEDNRDGAASLQMLLTLLGYEARVAHSGTDGVRAAREWAPDVVLCDIGLPELDGFGVAEQLRGDPRTAGALLVAVTGYGPHECPRSPAEAGFDHHLTKPLDLEHLQQLLAGSLAA